MIHKTIRLLLLGLVLSAGVNAQSIQDGIRALNSDRLADAKNILSKMNSAEAQYWMARVLLNENKAGEARELVNKGLATFANDPMLLAAKGEFMLADNKPNEAKQLFEQAVTASKAKKAEEATILNAIGRAITATYPTYKNGDLNYAIQKLEGAIAVLKAVKEKNREPWRLSDAYTNLGDAYRMAKPGEGSLAFAQYQNAVASNPNCAKANFRMAQIFKSQRNYDLQQEYLNKAITANPTYLPAYYELYLYKLGTRDNNGALAIAEKIRQNNPGDPNNDYFTASTYYLNKQYDQAISTANALLTKAAENANPNAYKVIAWSYIDKKDTAKAIPYVDKYFTNVKRESIEPKDYTMKAIAYSSTPGKEALVYQTYIDGLAADTVLENKIDLVEEGAKFFTGRAQYEYAGNLYSKLIEIKPANRVTINDYFNAGYYGYYKAGAYEKSWKIFDQVRTRFPNQNYGYLWAFRNSSVFDSTNAKNIMVADAEKLIAFSKTDTSKDAKANILSSSFYLANYYNDVAKDKAKAIEYLTVARDSGTDDQTVKQQIQQNIDMLQKAATSKPAPAKPATPAKPAASAKPKGGR